MKKASDATIAKWIKLLFKAASTHENQTAVNLMHDELRRTIPSSALVAVLDETQRTFSAADPITVPADRWISLITAFRDQRCIGSAKVLWKAALPVIKSLPAMEASLAAPDARSIDLWRKVNGVTMPELARLLIGDPLACFGTAGADWLLAHGKPSELRPLLESLLEGRPRPPGLRSSDELVAAFLAKDSKGARLAVLLAVANGQERFLKRILEDARGRVVKTLPMLAGAKKQPPELAPLVRCLFARLADTAGADRRRMCAEMASLAGGLLSVDRLNPAGESALAAVAEIGRELRMLTLTPQQQNETWVTEPLKECPHAGGLFLTADGARQWGIVFERAALDRQPLSYLETLGYNLGLREIAKVGTKVSYVPREHEDTEGGILKGDLVLVITSGWRWDELPVVRAKIKRCKE